MENEFVGRPYKIPVCVGTGHQTSATMIAAAIDDRNLCTHVKAKSAVQKENIYFCQWRAQFSIQEIGVWRWFLVVPPL